MLNNELSPEVCDATGDAMKYYSLDPQPVFVFIITLAHYQISTLANYHIGFLYSIITLAY
jgi:hypothetical protein